MTDFSRILAIELADIGNLVLITPALAALRQTFPAAKLDVLTTPHAAPILNGTHLADEVICFPKAAFDRPADLLRPANMRALLALTKRLRSGHYDTMLFFHHLTSRFGALKYAALAATSGAPRRIGLDNGRGFFLTDRVRDMGFGAKHEARYALDLAALIGAKTDDERLRVGISEADRVWAAEHVPRPVASDTSASRPLIAIHPGSGQYSPARRWEPGKFAALADRLIERDNAQIVIVGGADDEAKTVLSAMRQHPSAYHSVIDLSGQTTLNQLAAVLERCDHFYGADSGVMHIAAAVTDVTAIFGPSNHDAWHPWSPHSQVIRTGVRCSPCFYVGHALGLREGCPARTCLRTLEVDQVLLTAQMSAVQTEAHPNTPDSQPAPFPTVNVLSIPVHALTFNDMLNQIGIWIKGDRPRQICTVNPEFLIAARRDSLFFTILSLADLRIPDGVGLLWAAKRLGRPLPERVTGSDGVPLIARRAALEGWRLFFLGARPGVAAEAARRLQTCYPGLQIVGVYAGSPAASEEDAIVERINASGADVLFVAYGAPAQDKWIARNLNRLTPRVAMGVGGSLDFVAGVTRRAPLWMRRWGIEWLHRLIQQPWRWRRMTRLPRFVLAVLFSRTPATPGQL